MNSGHVTCASSDVNSQPRAAYIHVPFCAHRCGYCDFTLIAQRDDLVGDYLRALEREIQEAALPPNRVLETLYFGGGTPTHPTPDQLNSLFKIVCHSFELSPNAEFTVEANPLDLTEEKIDLLADAGVNRISLGVQSFSERALKLLERDHTPAQIVDVVTRLRRRIKNISLDLIFGVPDQSLTEWRETLRQAIDLNPTHISAYGLTFETGTAFWTRRERGELTNCLEEIERDQFAIAMEELSAAGLAQYEISNYATPGFQSRHNHVYWNGDEYWAFGPGAARYVHGRRETNIRSVLGWLAKLERDESPVSDAEELEPIHRAREMIYLGLRRNRGVSRQDFFARTGTELDHLCGDIIRRQSELGLLIDDGNSIRLSPTGRFVADRVLMEFL